MAELPEICCSKFVHTKIHAIDDKNYYRKFDGNILCDECIVDWLPKQCKIIVYKVIDIVSGIRDNYRQILPTIHESCLITDKCEVCPSMTDIMGKSLEIFRTIRSLPEKEAKHEVNRFMESINLAGV